MATPESIVQSARQFLQGHRSADGRFTIGEEDLVELLADIIAFGSMWINADDAAPPHGFRILIFSRLDGEISVGCYRDGRWFDDYDYYQDGSAVEIDGVTHWMPFPKQPCA